MFCCCYFYFNLKAYFPSYLAVLAQQVVLSHSVTEILGEVQS